MLKHLNSKKILKWLLAYYLLGIMLTNGFTILRFSGSPDVLQIIPQILIQNLTDPNFYLLNIIWPIFLGLNVYNLLTLFTGR